MNIYIYILYICIIVFFIEILDNDFKVVDLKSVDVTVCELNMK